MRTTCGFALTAAFAGLVSVGARQAAPRVDAAGAVAAVAGTPAVAQALTLAQRDDALTLDDQVAVCEVPAPPFKEARRAEWVRRRFEQLGLAHVRIDRVGNVIGERTGASAGPAVVVAAHLDTVFPDETAIRITRDGPLISGLGVGDNCRGLAVLLAVARAMSAVAIQTARPVVFAATVGEEGLGDLRGTRALFDETLKGRVGAFVSVDGAGMGITHIAVGSLRYKVTIAGPGGHSYGAFGMANPVHALGRAVATIAEFEVPSEPKTTFNVGRIGGGTSINSIAAEAWMEVDMRSADGASLRSLDARFHRAVERAVAEENERWGSRGRLVARIELVGDRPAGRTPADASIVVAALAATRAVGGVAGLGEGSTDANVPIALGIPAVTVGGGGAGTGGHSRSEAFDATGAFRGVQRALLLVATLAGERLEGGRRED